MGFQRPELKTLQDRAVSDIESRLQGADAKLRRTVLNVLAMVHSGGMHGLYGYLAWLALQLMPDTAELEYLERWSSIWGIFRKSEAGAKGEVVFTGNNGAVIPAETLLQRADGAEFTVDSEAVIAGGQATVSVTAVDKGADGNTAAGIMLNLANPLDGINLSATVDAVGVSGGADQEDDDPLRQRLLGRIRRPPHGGASFDYEMWGLEVAAVARVWVFANHFGLGTVGVTFVCDDQETSIIPSAGKVQEVQTHIDDQRPVTADVTVFAPQPVAIDFSIQLSPNTSAVQEAVTAELNDLLQREAVPGGTILVSHLREAISLAAGETDHVLVQPAANVVYDSEEIAVMGAITWP